MTARCAYQSSECLSRPPREGPSLAACCPLQKRLFPTTRKVMIYRSLPKRPAIATPYGPVLNPNEAALARRSAKRSAVGLTAS